MHLMDVSNALIYESFLSLQKFEHRKLMFLITKNTQIQGIFPSYRATKQTNYEIIL